MNKVYSLFNRVKKHTIIFICFVGSLLISMNARAQYFGQNKVRYKNLKFNVYKTPHFEIYYYLKNDSMVKRFAQESELWYTLHQQVFKDTFKHANPIILYANHPDFQQTTAIDGEISVGTGGVTEGLKNRVVMPVMETNQTTRHVIGHELVHAFQYRLLLGHDSSEYENINNIPLWMIEGMAEYLSLGKKDTYTAMWMRDAYLNHDIPTVRDLTESSKYFPYRYGEAFWSFIGSTYGDTVIVPFFKNAARFGLEYGIRRTFGYDDRTLSRLWKNSIEATYKPFLKDTTQTPKGIKLVDSKNGGDLVVAPSVSPDGKYVAFLSAKSLFSIDLYLADAKTGRILRKLTSKVSNTHIDEFNFIESAGAWSPDGSKFAFSVFSKGRNRLDVVDLKSGNVIDNISMEQVVQFSNLSWSPNGKDIVFQGLVEGQGDLYSYNFDTKKIAQLTNDKFSDYQPSYSPDGKKIIFSSDRSTYDQSLEQDIPFNLAELDLTTGKVTDIKIFNGANNLNPQYSADGKQIYFLSNRDGFRNLYRYTIASGQIDQMTNLFTGISGITEYSPALSISNHDDVVYSYYRAQKYSIYNAKASDFTPVVVQPGDVNFAAGTLPPNRSVGVDLINSNLNNFLAYRKIPTDSVKAIPFRSKFKLDYLAGSGIGVGVSNFYGTSLSSGIQGVFSDILGRNQIFAAASVNGQIYDSGAAVTYVNQTGRWNLGVGVSHIPYQFGFNTTTYPVRNVGGKNQTVYSDNIDIIRNFEDAGRVFTSYPISRTTRFEVSGAASHNYYRVDRYSDYYLLDTAIVNGKQQIGIGNYIASDRKKIPNEEESATLNQNYGSTYFYNLKSYSILTLSTALIGDNSFFGVTAPLNGFRYRLEAGYNFGTYKFFSPTIDVRKYVRTAPVTFAARFFATGRFGDDKGLYPLFVGYPFYIRGYEGQTFYNNGKATTNGFTIDQLSGSRLAVFNFEVRLPFTGPEKLAAIKSKFLFTDLNLFFDAGLAWNSGDHIYFQKDPPVIGQQNFINSDGTTTTQNIYGRVPALSAGISLRINVFGAFILEPYLAVPFNRSDVKKPLFGLGFTPGW